jgi:hypothetical protein
MRNRPLKLISVQSNSFGEQVVVYTNSRGVMSSEVFSEGNWVEPVQYLIELQRAARNARRDDVQAGSARFSFLVAAVLMATACTPIVQLFATDYSAPQSVTSQQIEMYGCDAINQGETLYVSDRAETITCNNYAWEVN